MAGGLPLLVSDIYKHTEADPHIFIKKSGGGVNNKIFGFQNN